MIRRTLPIWLCLLAIWMQIFAPAAAMDVSESADPLSVICSHSAESGEGQSEKHDRRTHDHQHCLLCQSSVDTLLFDSEPTFTSFDYPVVSRLRWVVPELVLVRPSDAGRTQPRGPPTLV